MCHGTMISYGDGGVRAEQVLMIHSGLPGPLHTRPTVYRDLIFLLVHDTCH